MHDEGITTTDGWMAGPRADTRDGWCEWFERIGIGG